MTSSTTVQTLCTNSEKPAVKGWMSKIVNRSFLVADDFSGYSELTLVSLCKEINQELSFINQCIKSTKHKSGMYKVILATESKYQKELSRVKRRRTFLVQIKKWAMIALAKEREETSSCSKLPGGSTIEQTSIDVSLQISGISAVPAQTTPNSWTAKIPIHCKHPSMYVFNEQVKEALEVLLIEELGLLYHKLCEEAVRVTANDANAYLGRFIDSKDKDRWVNALSSHTASLCGSVGRKDEIAQSFFQLLEKF